MAASAKRRRGRPESTSVRPPVRRGVLLGVVLAAVLAVVGLIWLGQQDFAAPAVVAPAAGMAKGDPAAPVVIEEWADFQCPACRAFAVGPGRQLTENEVAAGRVRVVWRNLAFLGQESEWAAAAAECASEQGQFWAYHDKLFREQAGENRGTFRKENLQRFGAEIGLEPNAFNACVDSDRYLRQVQAETREGRRQGVNSTPTLFVNGGPLRGVPRYEQLVQAIAQAAQRAAPPAAARP